MFVDSRATIPACFTPSLATAVRLIRDALSLGGPFVVAAILDLCEQATHTLFKEAECQGPAHPANDLK